MLKLWPNQMTSTTSRMTSTNMSIPMVALLRHVSSLFYQLFIIVLVTLIPCTLNVRHGAFAFASAASASSSSSSSSAAAAAAAAASSSSSVAAESNYELHAAHISIDSIMMTTVDNNNNDLSQLTFEPNFLHFDELSVGETANKVVTIFNRHANRSVYLGSISGSVSDFYSSFFEENLVPPMGNTTFNVVFLPRQQAVIQAHLIIHTSFGVLNYEVKGKGIECPYRLSPLVGLKAPMNATLMPEIHMYNPYDTPLQIVEVYSSGGQFQLELPTSDDDPSSAISVHSSGGAAGGGGGSTSSNGGSSGSSAERSQTLWEIPPHCSRPVIRVRFTATHVGNSTAYIRIKVSARKNAALEKAVIVLPIEVEIFKEHGIYASTPFLNFGLSGTNDRPKSVTFRLLNSGTEPYEITAYSVEAEENVRNGITLELNTVRETANETYHTMTATVNWSRISAEQFFRGNIVIQTRRKGDTNGGVAGKRFQYRVPFVGGILRGSIQYNESLTRFHHQSAGGGGTGAGATTTTTTTLDDKSTAKPSSTQIVRDFRIKNNFDVVLAITNLTMSPDTLVYFRADKFKAKLLAPGEEATIFQIVQQPAAAQQSVTRSFHLHTNVSVYDIELFSFNGLLKRLLPVAEHQLHQSTTTGIDAMMSSGGGGSDHGSLPDDGIDEQSINFGILPLSTLSQIQLALVNHNPIPINIHNWKGTISSAAHIGITVPGCSKLTMKGLKFCNIVKPGEWIVFQIGVTSNTVGSFDGKFTVQTDYEVISTPIRFSTDMGILKFTTKMIDTENCFPGGVCKVNLTAYSTFTRSMHIKTIQVNNVCLENASKVDSSASPSSSSSATAAAAMELQDIDGFDECHVTNLSRVENGGGGASSGGGGGDGATKSPYVIYEDGEKPVIDAQSESFIDQLEIAIPRICDERCALNAATAAAASPSPAMEDTVETNRQRFLLLKQQLDRFHALSAKFQALTFHVQTNHIKRYDFNGSIEIVWPKLVRKGPIEFAISQVGHELTRHVNVYNPFDAPLQIHYHLHDSKRFGVDVALPPDIIEECANARITDDAVFSLGSTKQRQPNIAVIPPKTYHNITVNFMSENPGTYGTLLYIRNNFTVLEAVWITAKSVVPQFKFGNRKPGSKTPLLFELTDKHLRDCNHPNVNMRAVTAKRTFTAKNSGEVPIFMRELRIDDLPCEGYGYRILECAPFELPPNGSRKIEISFTPDFTLAMVKKTLYLDTSLNYSVNYTLLSMIAPLSLGVCSKALTRPEWESMMKNVTAVVLAVSFVCVLFAAYLDSMKVLKVHVENMSKAKGLLQPALDLRQIGLKSLFTDDAAKSGSTSNGGTSTTSTTNATSAAAGASTKQSLQSTPSLACTAKANGSVCKKKSSEKKRVPCPSTEVTTTTAAAAPSKKSYITEIAKKFTPKKSTDSKQLKTKSSPPPPQSQASAASNASAAATACATTGKKDKRPKDDSPTANFEEEETSSTTTESSSHSDDKSPNVKTKSKKSGKDHSNGAAANTNAAAAAALPQSKDKKSIVKKSKSLPLSYDSNDVDLNGPSSILDRSHEATIDEHQSFELTNAMDSVCSGNGYGIDDDIKMATAADIFATFGTPPNKSTMAMKMLNGKTPGREKRERTKTNDHYGYRKSLDANCSSFKSTAFEFSSPLEESSTGGSHPLFDLVDKSLYEHQYDGKLKMGQQQSAANIAAPTLSSSSSSSSFSLSSMMKTQPANKSNAKGVKQQMIGKTKNEAKSKDRKGGKKSNGDDAFSSHSSFESLVHSDGNRKKSSPGVDLGPIGTRKSPSSTPIWEPMHSIHNPIPINSSLNNLAGSGNDSNSFFMYPRAANYQRNDNVLNEMLSQHQRSASDQFGHYARQPPANADVLRLMMNGMYGNTNLDQRKQNVWESAMLNLLQQQQHQQQQQLAQQRLQSMYSSAPNSLWNSSNVFDATQATSSASYWPSVSSAAVSNAHEIRPPPGFGHAANRTDQRTLQQELLLRAHYQQQIQKQAHQQQQQQQQQQQNQTAQTDPMQYDLFSSLSSIWSNNPTTNDPNKKAK